MSVLRVGPLAVVLLGAHTAAITGCGSLAEGGGGDDNLPNAAAGPFRPLRDGEIGDLRAEPYAIDNDAEFDRDPSVLDVDGDPSTLEVSMYLARHTFLEDEEPDATAPTNEIVRYRAEDGRTFNRDPVRALVPEHDWQGGRVGAPSVFLVGEGVHMAYEAEGGIGIATSADGAPFVTRDAPTLGPAADGWDAGAVPTSPAVVVLPDGSARLFYVVELGTTTVVGEARSNDGVTFQRIGDGPALAPRDDPDAFDGARVGSPSVVLTESLRAEPRLRVYYAAESRDGDRTIGMATRDGLDGPFVRAIAPVFGVGTPFEPHEPCVVQFDAFSLLYVTQKAGRTTALDFPAVAVGVAPAPVVLPPPNPK